MSRAATVIILRYLMFVLSFSCHAEDILDNKPDDDDDDDDDGVGDDVGNGDGGGDDGDDGDGQGRKVRSWD